MAKAPTIVTASTIIRGRISGEEDLDVFGRIQGSIDLSGSITVDAAARIDADVSAQNLYVHGILVGNAQVSDTIHLTAACRVIGDLSAPRIIIDEGAQIRGLVDMGDSAGQPVSKTASRTAPPRRAAPVAKAEEVVEETDEPELPDAASAKRVSVKKRS